MTGPTLMNEVQSQICKSDYKDYSESKLLRSGDIETQPGPKGKKSRSSKPHSHLLIMVILLIVIINKIKKEQDVKQTQKSNSIQNHGINSIINILICKNNKAHKAPNLNSTSALISIMLMTGSWTYG